MKRYPKTYEDIFSSDRAGGIKFDINKVNVPPMDVDAYTLLWKKFLKEFYSSFFIGMVQLAWLRRHFRYGRSKINYPLNHNDRHVTTSFVKYLIRVVGKDIRVVTKSRSFTRIESYFETLFPGFEDGNPFENPEYYKFPYKNISPDYLAAVYQMDERMEILEEAERQDMTFAKFLDYVINYVLCLNDDLGKIKYTIDSPKDGHDTFSIIKVKKPRKK